MSPPLPAGAERVRAALLALGHAAEIVEFDGGTRTAADAAAAIGCQVAQIAKSIVFRAGSGRPVLVIASGVNRVDEAKIAAALGEAIGKADADFVRERTGFAIGGVAPLGHADLASPAEAGFAKAGPLAVFIDEDLMQWPEIWAAAGTPRTVFRLRPAELPAISGGRVIGVK